MTEMEEATQPAPKEPEPYLMIRLLELTNFKSYANTIKIGPFDRHMTSVVGPNGSGKSNVIDAMLFVFGFKANKCVPHPIAAVASRRNGAHGHAWQAVTALRVRVRSLPF